jgi:hypothetical protein
MQARDLNMFQGQMPQGCPKYVQVMKQKQYYTNLQYREVLC